MLIAIPFDSADVGEGKIVNQYQAKGWQVVDFDEGKIEKTAFYESFELAQSQEGWIDFVILANRFENAMEYLNEGIMVLAVRQGQERLDEILDGFKFKELDEVGF